MRRRQGGAWEWEVGDSGRVVGAVEAVAYGDGEGGGGG